MGLTSGIVDVGNLYDCLAGIYSGQADPDSILEKYHSIRSQKFNEIVNPLSSANIVRLFGQDPDTAGEKDEFLKMCKVGETDERVAQEFARGALALGHDFTEYYDKAREREVNGAVKMPENLSVVAAAVSVID
jgi:hypothetical protein